MGNTFGTRLFTLFHGHPVGRDDQGNRYFEERRAPADRRKRRWVMFRGPVDGSRVPPEWQAWLTHAVESPLTETPRHAWQTPYEPNHTGTVHAYVPKGHPLRAGARAAAADDYEPWRPE